MNEITAYNIANNIKDKIARHKLNTFALCEMLYEAKINKVFEISQFGDWETFCDYIGITAKKGQLYANIYEYIIQNIKSDIGEIPDDSYLIEILPYARHNPEEIPELFNKIRNNRTVAQLRIDLKGEIKDIHCGHEHIKDINYKICDDCGERIYD